MTSLIDELESALASGSNAQRINMLSRITDLFTPIRFQGAMVYQKAGSASPARDSRRSRRGLGCRLRQAAGPVYRLRSFRISRLALAPGAPVMPPPGCVPEPQR